MNEMELPGALAHAIAVQQQEWPCTMDARVWARKFNETLAELGKPQEDEGWLTAWFANAIMAGYDTAMIRKGGEGWVNKKQRKPQCTSQNN